MAVSAKFADEEIEVLKKYYPIGDWDALGELLPERTKSSIHKKAHRMGLKFDMSKKKGMTSETANARKPWTKEEEDIIIANYSIRPVEDFLELLPNRTKASVTQKAAKLGILSCYKAENLWTDEDLKFLRDNWEVESDFIIAKVLGKTREAVKDKRRTLELYRKIMDFEGYAYITEYVRGKNDRWRKDSIALNNNKCVVTGDTNFIVHHIYNMNNIMNEVFMEMNMEKKRSHKEYTKEELNCITEKFMEVQARYPLGICLRPDLHRLFHALYGQFDNNAEQVKRFIMNYKKGLYDDYERFQKGYPKKND